MGRRERREQVRDWRKLTSAQRASIVLLHGIEAAPESERWRWTHVDTEWQTVPDDEDEDPAGPAV